MALGKLSRLERLFLPIIIERGIDYKNTNSVRQLMGQKITADAIAAGKQQQWSATVYGTDRYRVQVELTQMPDGDMAIEAMHCSCPYDDYCKHLGATLLCIRELLKSGQALIKENSAIIANGGLDDISIIDSEALLQSLDMPALRGFIQQCLLHHPNMLDELVIWSSAYQDSKVAASVADNVGSAISVTRDPKVITSMRRQINTILDIDNKYYNCHDSYDYDYEYESDFDEENTKFKHLFAQFGNQPQYQIACILYWLEQLIAISEEYPEIDVSQGLYTGFAKFGRIVFGLAQDQNKGKRNYDIDYCPSWRDVLSFYTIDLADKALLQEVQQQVNEWQRAGNINETGLDCQPARVAFDLYIAKQDWYPAVILLNEHIETEKSSRYGDHQLEGLVMLKIALLAHLQAPEQNQKSLVNQNIANEQVNDVLAEFAYLPSIRHLLIKRALDLGALDIVLSLLHKGITIAEENGHAGTVTEWQKQLVDILTQTDHLSVDADTTAIIRQNCKALAFDRGSMIDEPYYKQWRETYQPDEWQQVISAEQERLKQSIKKSESQTKPLFIVTNSKLEMLAQIYGLEKQTEALVALLKCHPNAKLLKQYQAQIIDIDAPWLIAFYAQRWTQMIESINGRKAYKELAQDIQRMIDDLPSGIAVWQPLVDKWQTRFSEHPRKPALLDELSNIRWSKTSYTLDTP